MAMADALCTAAADGDVQITKALIGRGADLNCRSTEGFLPLCLAAFWGNSDVVKTLLENGAYIDGVNSRTNWTACHCAAFQGHGKVIMTLLERKPNLEMKDDMNRTAIDFASALDSIWPHFAVLGYKRTTKADLIKLKIVEKTSVSSNNSGQRRSDDMAYFSRPGSAYVMRTQQLYPSRSNSRSLQKEDELSYEARNALNNGDVLNESLHHKQNNANASSNPKFSAWRT